MKGYVQIYTGDGKGKTTAALGLAIRACGAGLRVYIGQFLKTQRCSEFTFIRERCPDVRMECFGRRCMIRGKPSADDAKAARRGLARLREAITGGVYDVVIADEINVAAKIGVVTVEDILSLLEARPKQVEFILTGRNADARVIERADLVTEMRKIKHYFDRGVAWRPGVEA